MDRYFIKIKDLLQNGAEECKLLEERPNIRNVGRYIVATIDEDAENGWGLVTCMFGKKVLVKHTIQPNPEAVSINCFYRRLTIGDLEDCAKWLLARNITS